MRLAETVSSRAEPVARPGLRVALGLCVLMLVHHFGLWAWTAFHRGFPLLEGLDHWDSRHFSAIVTQGYAYPRWAFLPLYPLAVGLVHTLLGGGVPPQVVGCALSTTCLLVFTVWVHRRGSEQGTPSAFVPRTAWGWFLLFFSPASYSLHSHHTEGLFLLLSFGAFASAWEGRFWRAGVFAGLCVLTRNQGVVVAVAAALLSAERASGARERFVRFAGIGALALVAYGGLLSFEWLASGDALAHLHSQAHWPHAGSTWGGLRTLWFGNPGQSLQGWSLLRGVFYAVLLVGSVALWRESRAAGLYGLLSLALMLPQGDFLNAFRYGGVLFPALFRVGDWLGARPVWLRWSVAVLVVWLNHRVTHGYIIGLWSY